jgi:type VI secretion system secreted protein Hcp
MRTIDKASPQLFSMAATGEHIKEVVLSGQMGGENPITFYKVTLQDVMVSSFWQMDGNGHTSTEWFHLNFAKIIVEYTPMKADGTAAETIKAGYDVKSSTKI